MYSSSGYNVCKMALKIFLLLAFTFVSTKGGALFDPCPKDDIKCLSTATEMFLSKTYSGVPMWGLKPIDPLIIITHEVNADEDMGLVFNFSNLNVTGLKSLKISDFKMETTQKSVLLKMNADITLQGDVDVKLTKSLKSLKGPYTATFNLLGTSEYTYNLKDVNGTEYFEVGDEKNTCEIVGEPVVRLGSGLQEHIDSDQDAVSLRSGWETKKLALHKKTLCQIISVGLATVISNLRTSAKAFPKTAFFVDI